MLINQNFTWIIFALHHNCTAQWNFHFDVINKYLQILSSWLPLFYSFISTLHPFCFIWILHREKHFTGELLNKHVYRTISRFNFLLSVLGILLYCIDLYAESFLTKTFLCYIWTSYVYVCVCVFALFTVNGTTTRVQDNTQTDRRTHVFLYCIVCIVCMRANEPCPNSNFVSNMNASTGHT